MTKSRSLVLSMAVLLTAAPLWAGDRQFHNIVTRLSDAYQKKPLRFMGLLSLTMRLAHPEGVGGMKMAIFEDIDPRLGSRAPDLDGLMQTALGSEFHPFVRVRSNRDKQRTYIYARDVKGRAEMLLVVVEPTEAVVMKMRLKPDAMRDWVNDPVGQGRAHHHGGWNPDWDD